MLTPDQRLEASLMRQLKPKTGTKFVKIQSDAKERKPKNWNPRYFIWAVRAAYNQEIVFLGIGSRRAVVYMWDEMIDAASGEFAAKTMVNHFYEKYGRQYVVYKLDEAEKRANIDIILENYTYQFPNALTQDCTGIKFRMGGES